MSVDSETGLPGTLLYSGTSTISGRILLLNDGFYDVVNQTYALPSLTLAAGSYYIGLQAVSTAFGVYLDYSDGFNTAAQSNDGGTTWMNHYEGAAYGLAVSLSGDAAAVPEPASWALLIAGFGLVGAAMRRRVAATA